VLKTIFSEGIEEEPEPSESPEDHFRVSAQAISARRALRRNLRVPSG
jgi:hypothetical protein